MPILWGCHKKEKRRKTDICFGRFIGFRWLRAFARDKIGGFQKKTMSAPD